MTRCRSRSTRAGAGALAMAAMLGLAACSTDDGRQMQPPTEPLPATTTTTLVPPKVDGG